LKSSIPTLTKELDQAINEVKEHRPESYGSPAEYMQDLRRRMNQIILLKRRIKQLRGVRAEAVR
jgi:hypothetical protein